MSEARLQDRVIIITGGATGLGYAMARAMHAHGARLVIVSRNPANLERAAQELASTGPAPFVMATDVRDPEQVERLVDRVVDTYGTIDVLVNNAAANFLCPSEELSYNGFRTVVDIVLMGSFYCSLLCGRHMIQQGHGTILNILAPYIYTGSPYVLPSACAKAGVAAMTRTLAAEWGKYGIRVNGIAPGPFPTRGAWQRLMPDPVVEQRMKDRIPLRRLGRPEELAALAVFLVSDEAAYINGEIVFIDGGQWLRQGAMFGDLEGYETWMRKMRPQKKKTAKHEDGTH